jgi:hypothetical protein
MGLRADCPYRSNQSKKASSFLLYWENEVLQDLESREAQHAAQKLE